MAQESVDLLVIENVSKSFDGRCVLNNVSAKLTTGKILGLIGKSAAGKSVLIHMLRGSEEYAPDSGRVIYNVNRCTKCGELDLPFPGAKCPKCGGNALRRFLVPQGGRPPQAGREGPCGHHAPEDVRPVR